MQGIQRLWRTLKDQVAINHIWVTTFCREILGPSIQHPVLSGSVAPVTEMENAEGVNWEINDPDYYRKDPDSYDLG